MKCGRFPAQRLRRSSSGQSGSSDGLGVGGVNKGLFLITKRDFKGVPLQSMSRI